jgi:hypothetical protein
MGIALQVSLSKCALAESAVPPPTTAAPVQLSMVSDTGVGPEGRYRLDRGRGPVAVHEKRISEAIPLCGTLDDGADVPMRLPIQCVWIQGALGPSFEGAVPGCTI